MAKTSTFENCFSCAHDFLASKNHNPSKPKQQKSANFLPLCKKYN